MAINTWFEWVNDANLNARTTDNIESLLETGFVPSLDANTKKLISSTQVNTVLRQSNIITVALMKALGVTGSYKSSIGNSSTGLTKSILDAIKAVKVTIKNALDVLGISAPERM